MTAVGRRALLRSGEGGEEEDVLSEGGVHLEPAIGLGELSATWLNLVITVAAHPPIWLHGRV